MADTLMEASIADTVKETRKREANGRMATASEGKEREVHHKNPTIRERWVILPVEGKSNLLPNGPPASYNDSQRAV